MQVNNFCLYGNLQISFCCCTGILLVSHVGALILSPALLNCSAGSVDPFFPPFPDYVMENSCLCWQRPFSAVTTGVSGSLPCMFILSHPPPSLISQDLAYFLRPKQLRLPYVSHSLLPLLSLLCWILNCPCKLPPPLFFTLCSFPFLSAASPIPSSALTLSAGWASLVGCTGGAGCVLLSCWWFSTILRYLWPFLADVAVFPQNSNF